MYSRTAALVTTLIAAASVAWAQSNPTAAMERLNQEHAVFFSGKVMLADGSAPEGVLIQRVCDGRAHNEGVTDSTGAFNFKVDLGSSNTPVVDAAQPTGPSPDLNKPFGSSTQYTHPITAMLQNCDVQAVLAGYRTESVRIETQSMRDGVRLPDITLHPLKRADKLAVSVTTLTAPSAATKAYEKGLEAERQQKLDAAAASFAKATKTYPDYAEAWFRLGLMRQRLNNSEGAADAWREARRADPKFVKPLEGLTNLADARGDWSASERYSSQWIDLAPDDFPAAYLFHAIAEARLNKMEAAEKDARTALRLDKKQTIPRINYVLGVILLNKQAYAESAQCFRTYLTLAPGARDAAMVQNELSRIEQMAIASPRP